MLSFLSPVSGKVLRMNAATLSGGPVVAVEHGVEVAGSDIIAVTLYSDDSIFCRPDGKDQWR